MNKKKNRNELFNFSMMLNTEGLDYLTKCIKMGKGHLQAVIKIIVSHYYHQNCRIMKERHESLVFDVMVYILILNDLFTEGN